MWTQLYEIRSPLDVITEIEAYIREYQITHVEFVDLTAIVKKDWIMQFGRLMEERKINVSWSLPSGTRSEALDEEVIELMARTRCYYLVYAAESGSERVLKLIKTNPSRQDGGVDEGRQKTRFVDPLQSHDRIPSGNTARRV